MNAGVDHPRAPAAQATGTGSAADSLARLSAVAVIVVRDAQLPAGAASAATPCWRAREPGTRPPP